MMFGLEWKKHRGTHMAWAVVGFRDGERITWFECHTEKNADELVSALNGEDVIFTPRYMEQGGK